jgi:hypothetical protein
LAPPPWRRTRGVATPGVSHRAGPFHARFGCPSAPSLRVSTVLGSLKSRYPHEPVRVLGNTRCRNRCAEPASVLGPGTAFASAGSLVAHSLLQLLAPPRAGSFSRTTGAARLVTRCPSGAGLLLRRGSRYADLQVITASCEINDGSASRGHGRHTSRLRATNLRVRAVPADAIGPVQRPVQCEPS